MTQRKTSTAKRAACSNNTSRPDAGKRLELGASKQKLVHGTKVAECTLGLIVSAPLRMPLAASAAGRLRLTDLWMFSSSKHAAVIL